MMIDESNRELAFEAYMALGMSESLLSRTKTTTLKILHVGDLEVKVTAFINPHGDGIIEWRGLAPINNSEQEVFGKFLPSSLNEGTIYLPQSLVDYIVRLNKG